MKHLLVCPMGKGKLVDLACASCRVTFPMNNGVPSFICQDMYPSKEAYAAALKIIDFGGASWEKRLAEPEHKPIFEYDERGLRRWAEQDIEFQKASDSIMGVDLPMDSLKGKTVLNIGSGAGTEALLLSVSGANCIAMDVTSQAAQAAETLMQKVGSEGMGIQADVRFIPLASSSLDIVYSSGVLHHSPDIARSIAEIYRVLKPGGKAYVMLYATWSIMFVQMRLMFSTGERAWETGDRTNPHTTTYTKRECRSLFSQFVNVEVRKTGASLKHHRALGKFMPTTFDQLLDPWLGPRLNIEAEKAGGVS